MIQRKEYKPSDITMKQVVYIPAAERITDQNYQQQYIESLASPEYAANIAKLSKSLEKLTNFADFKPNDSSSRYGKIMLFGPDEIDELAEIILIDKDNADLIDTSYVTSRSPVIIKQKVWIVANGYFTKIESSKTYELNHFLLAVLCHEDKLALKLFAPDYIKSASFYGFNFFELLLIIDSKLIEQYKDQFPEEFIAAATKLMIKQISLLKESFYDSYIKQLFSDIFKRMNLLLPDIMAHVKIETLTKFYVTVGLNKQVLELIPAIVSKLLTLGVSIDTPLSSSNDTMLFKAARINDISLCVFLLENGANISHRNTRGEIAFDNFEFKDLVHYSDPGGHVHIGDPVIYLVNENFIKLLDIFKANTEATQAVRFLRPSSRVLFNLCSTGDWDLAQNIYSRFPYLLEVTRDDKSALDMIPKDARYANNRDFELIINQQLKSFLLLVKVKHPRIFLKFVLADKRLRKDLIGSSDDVKYFANQHGCQDLIHPSRLQSFTSAVTSVFMRQENAADQTDEVLDAVKADDIEQGKGKYPVAQTVAPEEPAPSTNRFSLSEPLLRFTRRKSRVNGRAQSASTTQDAYLAAVENLPIAPTAEVILPSSNEPKSARKEEPRMLPG